MIFNQFHDDRKVRQFTLSPGFLDEFKDRQPNWGPVGYFTYKRTYSLPRCDCDNPNTCGHPTEEFWQTCQRVVEGTYNVQKIHCRRLGLPWSEPKAQKSAQEMYRRMWEFKFTPPGRGLAKMGTDFVFEKGGASLNNCSFVSSERIDEDFAEPFCFLMDMSMLGVGVGGDVRGAGKVKLQKPKTTDETFQVGDSREGWVAMTKTVLSSFVGKGAFPTHLDFSEVRPKGHRIRGFGGTASGPGPLAKMVKGITRTLVPRGVKVSFEEAFHPTTGEVTHLYTTFCGEGEPRKITSADIADVFNMVGACVVAGGVRRSAEILFGDADDEDFRNLKDDSDLRPLDAQMARLQARLESEDIDTETRAAVQAEIDALAVTIKQHPLRSHRWASNNSIFGHVGMGYDEVGQSIARNGEPGIFWLKNAQDYGRLIDPANFKDRRVLGANPCSEQSLESYELCVGGTTRITTQTGAPLIQDTVGKTVNVWNGTNWSSVTPFITGQERSLYRVHLSDGSYLDCTDNHKWEVLPEGKRAFREIETKDLVLGSQVMSFNINLPCEGESMPCAYEWGFFTGDGFLDNAQVMSKLHGASDRKLEGVLRGKVYKEQHPEGYAEPFVRVNFTGNFREIFPDDYLDRARDLNNKITGLPDWLFSLDRESTLRFIAGWIDSDGTLNKQVSTDNYTVYGTESKIRDLQMLLRRVGINHASVFLNAEAGQELVINGRTTVRNHDLWVCLIPSYEGEEISRYCHLKVARRFGSRYATNNAHPEGAPIDRARKQKIVDIEVLPGKHTTYCFDEPERHMAVFNNVLTHQCTLVETYPAHHDSYEDFERTLKFAYLYAKTVTLIPTHNPRSNAVMNRNRRIGCSMSGIRQAIEKFGRREFLNWCDQGYKYIQNVDVVYADWLGVPRSIKTTSVKPSGTVSLLCNATPGMHPAHSPFYIRNIRVNQHSRLLPAAREAGYKVEPDAYADGTFVISFPVKTDNCTQGKRDVSLWDQVALAADLQRYWADNQVSCTVSFTAEEAQEIPRVLEVFEDRLKSISFLPLGDDHGYVQAPYIEIPEEEYERLQAGIHPMDLSGSKHEADDMYCDGALCEIKP